jgi:outer membrane receptor protein involved in Fe transport
MSNGMRVVLAGLLFAVAPRAAAGDAVAGQADEAQFYFLRGNRAYQEKRFEDALASYYLSNRLVANRNVQFNIARCLDRLGRYDEAYRAWSTLLEASLPDKERKAAEEAIQSLRPHLALVEIESTPAGATIYAGRRDLGALGVTPKRLALRPGPTAIILEHEGYRPVELSAVPEQGKAVKLSATLARIHGTLDIRHVPADAVIRRDFLDGEVLRRGPGTIQVLPGPLVLFISAPGFASARMMVSVPPDGTTPVDVILQPAKLPTGSLVVRCNIASALIRVDGQEAGFTPAVIDAVPTGRRQVEILAEGRRPFTTTVEVKPGERASIDGYLGHADPEITAATKSSIASESAPASITVITADEIAALGYTSLTEALTTIRGAFVSNDRSYESLGFRGFSPPGDYTNRVLVLVDGHSTNDAVTGQGYVGRDFDVDLANVARIEIVRGPGSVLYGTGALFGVINVVTRRAATGPHAALETWGASASTGAARATASFHQDGIEVAASVAALRSSGERRYPWPAALNGGVPVTVFDADDEQAEHADLVARFGPVSFRSSYNHRRKYLPTGAYETQPVAGTFNDDHRSFVELRFDQTVRGFGLAARAAYDASWYRGHFINTDPTALSEEPLKAQWLTGELRGETPEWLRQRFTLGAEVVRQLQLLTDPPVAGSAPIRNDLIVSAYLVDDIRLSPRLAANLGVRADSYTRSVGTTLNPRVALIGKPYRAGNTKLFFGRSFRAPSPNERANSPGPSLRPETIWSVELEHVHKVTDDVTLLAAVYVNWLDHLLGMWDDPNLGTPYRNNPNRVRSMGLEGEARWEPGGGTLVSVSAARQRVEELTPDGTRPFLNAPQTMLKARVLCPLVGPALRLGSELVLDSGRPFRQTDPALAAIDYRTDDALLWNLTFSGAYRRYHLRYFAGVFNLLDVREARSGFPTSVDYLPTLIPRYGRSVRVGLSLAL